jgi:uncharacterized protein YlxW (UPF0749 family)
VAFRTIRPAQLGPYIAVAILGFAIVISATLPHPGPRVARRARLIDLIAQEDQRARALRKSADDLQTQIDRLEQRAGAGQAGLSTLQAEIDRLGVAAGLAEVTGPGLLVEMRDSTLRKSPTGDPNDLVIHEQDIQAVVNALWAGGAEAMSINGERLTSDSAVRCVGNTLLLHGSVYSPPYRISAIGNATRLNRALANDTGVERFNIFVDSFRLGFTITPQSAMVVPAFRGVIASVAARTLS